SCGFALNLHSTSIRSPTSLMTVLSTMVISSQLAPVMFRLLPLPAPTTRHVPQFEPTATLMAPIGPNGTCHYVAGKHLSPTSVPVGHRCGRGWIWSSRAAEVDGELKSRRP